MTRADAQTAIDAGAEVGTHIEIRECGQVPDHVHLVVPPETSTEPGT